MKPSPHVEFLHNLGWDSLKHTCPILGGALKDFVCPWGTKIWMVGSGNQDFWKTEPKPETPDRDLHFGSGFVGSPSVWDAKMHASIDKCSKTNGSAFLPSFLGGFSNKTTTKM